MASESVKQGQQKRIIANPAPLGYSFNGWTGDTQYLDNPANMQAIVTMPDTDVTVTSNYLLNGFVNISYGYLYNWYAANDIKNIASNGWHIPSKNEWLILKNYGNDSGNIDLYVRETGTTYWQSSARLALITNNYQFNARGSGYRSMTNGTYQSINTGFQMILSDSYFGDPTNGFIYCNISYSTTSWTDSWTYKWQGAAVRLLKDSTTLTHGQIGSYIGNDGKVYPTICIGTQEWLSCNLAETKYRDGSDIPTVTDNTAWAALTTGAKCAYNNDENNV